MSQMISGLPAGTLGAGTIVPGVDIVGGVRTNVEYNLISLLQTYPRTTLTIGGAAQAAVTLNPANFSLSGGVLSVVGGGGSSVTLNGTAVTALDPASFTLTGTVASVTTTSFASLAAASGLTGAWGVVLVNPAGTGAFACTLGQLATEIVALTAPAIGIGAITAQYAGNPFTISGTLANYAHAPTLTYQDNSNAATALPGGATVTSSTFTFSHPALAVGTYTVIVADANGVTATSDAFVVSYASATAATLSGVPGTGTAGTSITGVTVALTPSYAQAYAVLDTGGADQGARTAFTGSSVPALTPASPGSYTIVIYAASAGGTALATSSAIAVSATVATAATITGAPSTGTGGVAITGVADTLTPGNATAYAVLNTGGADQGARVAFSGTTIPSLTPAVGAAGSYTIKIYAAATGGAALATSGAITVTDIATAATISGAPSAAYEGAAITGLTASLTPADATAYAALFNGATQQGTRTAFTGTAVPSLTPTGTGSYTVQIYAAATGGAALATSAAIAVTVLATAATVTAPGTGTAGGTITATVALTPTNATAYACLNNGSDILPRTSFTGNSVVLTLGAAGSYTVKIYAAATGGAALATSGAITVSAAAAPSIAGGIAPLMVLDASVAANVTSDNAFTTPQTANGGAVLGWKDSTSNGFNWSANATGNSGVTGGTLVTNSSNGLNGVQFAGGTSYASQLQLTTALATALGNNFNSATACFTMAIVCENNDNAPSGIGSVFQVSDAGYSNYVRVGPGYGGFFGLGRYAPAGSYSFNTGSGTRNIVVMTYNPATQVSSMFMNNTAPIVSSGSSNYAGYALVNAQLGIGGSTTNIVYEVDIWPGLASGTGGATPTGDIAAIMTYLTNKWA